MLTTFSWLNVLTVFPRETQSIAYRLSWLGLHCILDTYYSIYTFYLFQSFHFNTALWVISNQQWECLGSLALCQIRHLVLHKNCGNNIKSVILIFINGVTEVFTHQSGMFPVYSSYFFDKWDSQAWKRIFYALLYIASREIDPNVSQENVTFELYPVCHSTRFVHFGTTSSKFPWEADAVYQSSYNDRKITGLTKEFQG